MSHSQPSFHDHLPSTRAVHEGAYPDSRFGSVTPPIYTSSTFRWEDPLTVPGIDYARCNNPTRQSLQENLAALEGGVSAFATASGMSAVHTCLLLLEAGDHVICADDAYAGTYRLFTSVLAKLGIRFSFVDMGNPDAVKAEVTDRTRMFWVETPSNPLMKLTDIASVAEIRDSVEGAFLVVDNTFLTPVVQRPIELGADLVVHATTKFLNGHSDVIGGAIVCREEETSNRIQTLITAIGSGQSAFDAYLVHRGIRTLFPRMEVHQRNAGAIAGWLSERAEVAKVHFPGLADHPGTEIAERQQNGPGGMLSFELRPEGLDPLALVRSLRVFQVAVSLGGVESLAEIPWYMSHHALTEDERRGMGLSPRLIRLSPGLEAASDLIADLEQAIERAR